MRTGTWTKTASSTVPEREETLRGDPHGARAVNVHEQTCRRTREAGHFPDEPSAAAWSVLPGPVGFSCSTPAGIWCRCGDAYAAVHTHVSTGRSGACLLCVG